MVRIIRPPPTPPKVGPVIGGYPSEPTLEPTNVEAGLQAIYDYADELRNWAELLLIEQREQAADIATNVTDIAGKAATVHVHAGADITTGTLPDARIQASGVTQHEGSVDHDALNNHVAGQHRIIGDAGTSATELWSASKINTVVAAKPDDFTDLGDVPTSYTSQGSKMVKVASGETALEFTGIQEGSSGFLFPERTTAMGTPGTDICGLYFKDAGGTKGLYMINDVGSEIAVATF